MKKLTFTKKVPQKTLNSNKNKILNFLNMESLWHYKNNPPPYSKLISEKHNINFPDGRLIGLQYSMFYAVVGACVATIISRYGYLGGLILFRKNSDKQQTL